MSFSYEAPLQGRAIRLLRIDPGHAAEPVRCRLLGASLDRPGPYDALSYVWGSQNNTLQIFLDDKPFSVTHNLHHALQQIRKRDTGGLLWVDAICINQRDEQEKTRQVRMMRDVYTRAKRVIVWLGTTTMDAEPGLKLLSDIDRWGARLSALDRRRMEDLAVTDLGLPPASDPAWKSLSQLLLRPWFGRIWVVQELVLAAQCTILYGTCEIRPAVLFSVITHVNRMRNIGEALFSHLYENNFSPVEANKPFGPCKLIEVKTSIDNGKKFKLIELWGLFRAFEASDPRDKVFGLVGLVHDVAADFVDYSLTNDEVLVRLARKGFSSSSEDGIAGLDLLSLSDPSARDDESDVLPSWVPTHRPNSDGFLPLAPAFPSETSVHDESIGHSISTNHTLNLQATCFDSVEDIVTDPDPGEFSASQMDRDGPEALVERTGIWDDKCSSLASAVSDRIYGGRWSEAYWRTLVCNRNYECNICGPDYARRLAAWRRFNADAPRVLGSANPNMDKTGKEQFATLLLDQQDAGPFEASMLRFQKSRRFCATARGYIGWVPKTAMAGDLLWKIKDCRMPFVLRAHRTKVDDDGSKLYVVVGAVYLHGMMGDPGDLLWATPIDDSDYRDIKLV